ncbi:MAG: YchJ family metal-binding protein [Myxococcaceae bacterium]|nr:YchJ family metal-binding protein [Myxococcaceae bacterium]
MTSQDEAGTRCPCGSGPYDRCCGPRHTGARPAETAEALMRSRYSAFALGRGDYLVETSTRAPRPNEAVELSAWGRSVGWVGLTVEVVERGGPDEVEGIVQFTARYVEAGTLVSLSERSSFTRLERRWAYVEGQAQTHRQKLGRNEPCPCGSGRKVKQCHG